MTDEASSEELLRYVQDRAGEYFRGFAIYDAEGAQLVATREGLSRGDMEDRVQELHRAIQTRADFEAVETLGPPSSVVQVRDHAVLVNFPLDDERGYLLGLEPEAARNLHTFVDECREIIHDAQ